MEELTFQIEKTAGLAREDAECGVINKKIVLADGEVGHLICCLLVYDSEPSKRQDSVRDIIELAERNLEGAEGSVLDVLKETLEGLKKYLEEQGVQASFLITFFYKNVCYIARHGDRVKLMVYENSSKSEIDIEAGSGPVAPGQTYLIATGKFLELFDESTYLKEDLELSEIIDGLATEISANADQAEIGAVFVRAGGLEPGVGNEVLEDGLPVIKDDAVEVRGDFKNDEETDLAGAEGEHEVSESAEEIVGGTDEKIEAEVDSGEQGPRESDIRMPQEEPEVPRINPAVLMMKRVSREIGKIRRGDIKAILRLRKNILFLAILIVIGLGVFGGYTMYQKNEKAKELEVYGYLSSARSKLEEGTSIIELNKQRAREILIEAQKEAEKAKKINNRNEEVLKLIAEIERRLSETEQTASINFSTFAEVGSSVASLAFNGSKVEVFVQDKIIELDSNGKVLQEYEGISGVKSGTVYDNKAFVLAEGGTIRLDLTSGKISTIADSVTGLDIGVFFGNVYLLSNSQIGKYVPIEGGYSEAIDYLEKPENFGSNSRMAIDSLVWATSGNKILKFNRGVAEDFEISGLPGGGGEFGLIFTDSNLDNIYVVDKTNSALLVIDKNGVYKQALTSPEFGRAGDILVNDAENKIYVATDSKILSTEIK